VNPRPWWTADNRRRQAQTSSNPCSLEQFVVLGHSDGATAIYQLLMGGEFNGETRNSVLRPEELTPAFIGMMDLVRLIIGILGSNVSTVNPKALDFIDAHRVRKPETAVTVKRPENTVLHNLLQNEAPLLKGRYVYGAKNFLVTGFKFKIPRNPLRTAHEEMPTHPGVVAHMAIHAAKAYGKRIDDQVRKHPEMHAGAGTAVPVHTTKEW